MTRLRERFSFQLVNLLAVSLMGFYFVPNSSSAQTWITFVPPEKNYRILFPAPPRPMSETIKEGVELRMYVTEFGKTGFMAGSITIPGVVTAEQRSLLISKMRSEALSDMQATLKSATSIIFGSAVGNEFEGVSSNSSIRGRIYANGSELFQVWAITDTKNNKALAPTIDRFFRSFEILSETGR